MKFGFGLFFGIRRFVKVKNGIVFFLLKLLVRREFCNRFLSLLSLEVYEIRWWYFVFLLFLVLGNDNLKLSSFSDCLLIEFILFFIMFGVKEF